MAQGLLDLGFQGCIESVNYRKEVSIGSVLRQYPPVVQSSMCSRDTKSSVGLDEEIAKIASALTRTNDPWTGPTRLLLIEQQ